jgi:hypothetical protein
MVKVESGGVTLFKRKELVAFLVHVKRQVAIQREAKT